MQTAQDESKRKPYLPLVFTSKDGLTTVDYSFIHGSSSNRLVYVEHQEFPYDDFGTIILQNDDRAVPDLRGYYVEIGYGDVTGAGNESSGTARLWVENQQFVSAPGVLVCQVTLEGMKRRLMRQLVLTLDGNTVSDGATGEINCDWNYKWTDKTYYEILEYIIETVMGWTLLPLAEFDGIINVTVPEFEINFQAFEYAGIIIERLMNQTKCYLRYKAGLEVEVKYPHEGDAVDEEFFSNQQHYFYEYNEKDSVLIPNHIIVYGNEDLEVEDSCASVVVGGAEDVGTNEQRVTEIHKAVGLKTTYDVLVLAQAILRRYNAERTSGMLLTPHSAKTELYDRALIYDYRGT